MDKLKPLIEKLKKGPPNQLDVMDCITENMYKKAVTQEFLDKNHNGSLLEFLKDLKTKGLQKVQLIPRLKNGNASKPGGVARTVDLNGGSSAPESNVAAAPLQMPGFPTGLNGAFGLSMPDIMDGFAAKRELEQWKQNCAKYEKMYEDERRMRKDLSEKILQLTRENDQYSWSQNQEKEPSKFDKIIDGIFQNPEQTLPALMGMFNQLKGGGMNAPVAQISGTLDGYTEMQQALCQTIGELPDEFCESLAEIITRVSEPDPVFTRQLKALLETPNLKAVQNG